MVVIEPTIEEENEEIATTKKVESSSISKDNHGEEPETVLVSKDVSEGFETASEGDNFDRGSETGGDGDNDNDEQHETASLSRKDDSYEDALDDDQLKQKALAQANDAKVEGNELFKAGQFEDALSKYELALQLAPEMPSSVELRSICHSNRGVCYLKLRKYDETVKGCTKALELNPAYVKALVRRGEAYEKLERYDEAIADMKKILELEPSNDQARRNIIRLEPLAREKMEKMKEEMIGKLKEMGNSLLGRFGMSVDNFKTVQDPNTGAYSVSFQR